MTEFILHRYEDPSNVSGTGVVAWGVEWADGAVALRWPGDNPSTAAWGDIRDVEAIHGHAGKTLVEYLDYKRLLAGYRQVVFWLTREMTPERLPLSVGPHPDWPDRLLVKLTDERAWMFWTALLDGSTDAATHVAVGNETRHTWVHPEGNVWLEYTSDATYDEHPLKRFHEEDR